MDCNVKSKNDLNEIFDLNIPSEYGLTGGEGASYVSVCGFTRFLMACTPLSMLDLTNFPISTKTPLGASSGMSCDDEGIGSILKILGLGIS